MIHCVVITQNSTSGSFTAKWLSTHSSNGLDATGRHPVEALRNLADVIDKAEDRRMAILANDEGDDD